MVLSMRLEKCLYQGHVLFESHTANQVAGIPKVHDPGIGLHEGIGKSVNWMAILLGSPV